MNLGFHEESNEQVDTVDHDDFDIEEFKEQFEKEYEEEVEETSEEEQEVEETSEEEQEEEQQSDDAASPETKVGKAFAQMRNQLKESEKYSNFVKNLSDAYGVEPEELIKRFEEQQLKREAETQGTSPEVLRRLRELETQNENLTKQQINERIGADIEKIKKEFGIDDKDETIQKTFDYMAQGGYVDSKGIPKISFEDAYFLANKEAILDKKIENAKQKELEMKKRRQSTSALPADTGDSPDDDYSLEEVEKRLRSMGLID